MKDYAHEQPWLPLSETLLEWDEAFHQLMLGDSLRMLAYEKAIKESIRPGDVVLDLGTGTGILSLWALQAGASHVYGIDLDNAILQQAKTRLEQAGFAGRFEAINRLSYEVELSQPVDVLISEIMGNLADNENFQPILQDGIARFLKPGGLAIPLSVASYLVPVAAVKAHEHLCRNEVATLNAHYQLAQLCQRKHIKSPFDLYYDTIIPRHCYISEPALLRQYQGDWSQPGSYTSTLTFTADKAGCLTGFKGYFIAQLSRDTVLDISGDGIDQGASSDSWKHAFLPLENPITLAAGDTINLAFSRRAAQQGKDFPQIYSWSGAVTRDPQIIGDFSQSTGT
ncbi:MAG: methyltransferase domain-containing protein [Halomonadaceae bacterium]|nr:MAG: methyltransferase domain-containing protein [Halomonadaceae bacterium]